MEANEEFIYLEDLEPEALEGLPAWLPVRRTTDGRFFVWLRGEGVTNDDA